MSTGKKRRMAYNGFIKLGLRIFFKAAALIHIGFDAIDVPEWSRIRR